MIDIKSVQNVVDAFVAGLCEHFRGKIDTGEFTRKGLQPDTGQTSPAAQIRYAHRSLDPGRDHLSKLEWDVA